MSLVSDAMVEQARESLFEGADELMEGWSEYIQAIKSAHPEVSDTTLATTAIVLENTKRWLKRMDETTQSVNVGSFINHGFELLAAILPSLIANEVVSVQPMTRRIGEVFFMEFLYGSTRGTITKGQKMFAYDAVGNKNTQYTAEYDINEVIGTGNGGTKAYTGFLNSIPVVAGSVRVTDGVETFTEPSTPNGTLTGSAGGSGTINWATGEYAVSFNANVANDQAITATWDLDFQKNPDLIPEVDVSITSSPVNAQNRKLRARYTLDSAYDVEQAWGRSIDNELKAALAAEVRSETDGEILNQLLAQATSTSFGFSRTPDTGVAWADHKWAFYDKAVVASSNGIFENTRRVTGNFIVCGTDVATLIESLVPIFRREGSVQPGPHYIGMLGDFRVYKDPYYSTKSWLMGYKGSMFLEAGFVWAPYLPLYVTRTIVLDDTIARFGMVQSAGRKMINSKFYSANTIT